MIAAQIAKLNNSNSISICLWFITFHRFTYLIDNVADGHIPGRLEINRAAIHSNHMDIHLAGGRCGLFYIDIPDVFPAAELERAPRKRVMIHATKLFLQRIHRASPSFSPSLR